MGLYEISVSPKVVIARQLVQAMHTKSVFLTKVIHYTLDLSMKDYIQRNEKGARIYRQVTRNVLPLNLITTDNKVKWIDNGLLGLVIL